MSKTEYAKRYLIFLVSLFFSGLGVAFAKHGDLGVTPISSVANVMNCKYPSISMGTWLIFWNCLLIAAQIALLRKKFQPIQLLQLPLSFLFGWFTDIGLRLVSPIPTDAYAVKMLMVVLGFVVLGFGIALSVIANVVMNSGEAFVKAVADTTGKAFSNVKILFDVSCVLCAVLLSLLFFHGLTGTREGTLIAAVMTGVSVKCWMKLIRRPVEALFALTPDSSAK